MPGLAVDLGEVEIFWLEGTREARRSLAEVAGVAFEDAPPVRTFPSYRGQRHFPGLYWYATTGRHVGFESWLERDHAMALDFDPQVVGLASQPFWLSWADQGSSRRREHAPDYFARGSDGSGLVVDCRPESGRDERSVVSFAVTRQACEAVGWAYRLVGQIDAVRVANLRWLAGYRHPRFGASDAVVAAVVTAFSVAGPLLAQAGQVGDPIEVLPVAFHLLWRGRLQTNLSLPLGDLTVVEAGSGR
jgi:hypothetical protein